MTVSIQKGHSLTRIETVKYLYSKTPIYRRLWEHGKCGGKSVAALSGFSISESICLPIWPENTVRTNKYALNGLIIILA